MSLTEALLPEFDQEMANTRKVLERAPAEKFAWTPHPKSHTMGWLAGHLANLPYWVSMTLSTESFDIQPAGAEPPRLPEPVSPQEALASFDTNLAAARAAIASATDEQWMQPWSLLKGEHTIFTMPRIAVFRSMVMNHMIHHRAQLTIYFRLNDIPVPGLYGPSADET